MRAGRTRRRDQRGTGVLSAGLGLLFVLSLLLVATQVAADLTDNSRVRGVAVAAANTAAADADPLRRWSEERRQVLDILGADSGVSFGPASIQGDQFVVTVIRTRATPLVDLVTNDDTYEIRVRVERPVGWAEAS